MDIQKRISQIPRKCIIPTILFLVYCMTWLYLEYGVYCSPTLEKELVPSTLIRYNYPKQTNENRLYQLTIWRSTRVCWIWSFLKSFATAFLIMTIVYGKEMVQYPETFFSILSLNFLILEVPRRFVSTHIKSKSIVQAGYIHDTLVHRNPKDNALL